jgi:hypothetical protein
VTGWIGKQDETICSMDISTVKARAVLHGTAGVSWSRRQEGRDSRSSLGHVLVPKNEAFGDLGLRTVR